MADHLIRSFAWSLQVAVWTNRSPDDQLLHGRDEFRELPYLALVTGLRDVQGFDADKLVGLIQFSPGATKQEDRWLMRFYPDEPLGEQADESDPLGLRRHSLSTRGSAFRHGDLLREGEIREPRDTAKAALAALFRHVNELTLPSLRAAVAKTGAYYLSALESATSAWLNRPKSAR